MPPKARISKEMILDIVLSITRETGFEAVNARSIASTLKCSTRPIFTCYAMDHSTFELYMKYHLATCEREDLIGITSHAIDIFRK